jgi:hypothetical protein
LSSNAAAAGNSAYINTIDFQITCSDVIRWRRESRGGSTDHTGCIGGSGAQGGALRVHQTADVDGFADVGADLECLVGKSAIEQLDAVECGR